MARPKRVTAQKQMSELREKWGDPLIDTGWTAIPSVILERQQALGLDALDLAIIIHLVKYWWYTDRPSRPSKRKIYECLGIAESTLRKRIADLEKGGLIERVKRFDEKKGQLPNEYKFGGLIEKATILAEEEIQRREKGKTDKAAMRTRKSLRLQVADKPTG